MNLSKTTLPDPTYMCQRCASLVSVLKEWWIEYQGNSKSVNRKCDGNGSACGVSRCLTMTGTTLVTADVKVEDKLAIKSSDALTKLQDSSSDAPDDETIYIAVNCSEFLLKAPTSEPSECAYRSKVSDMLTVTASATTDSILQNISALVHWEYKLGSGTWKPLGSTPDEEEVFFSALTQISVHAWTNCGMLVQKVLDVKLHVYSNIVSVYESFPAMWTQSPASAKLGNRSSPIGLCLFPGSNFAALRFDFSSGTGGIQSEQSTGKFTMGVSRVTCELSYKSLNAVKVLDIKHSSGGPTQNPSLTIMRQFVVDTRRLPTTLSATCVSTYARSAIVNTPTSTIDHECSQEFKIDDYSKAAKEAGKSSSNESTCPKRCSPDANKSNLGLFEACGGGMISASKTTTVLSRKRLTCCKSCNAQCKAVAPPSLAEVPGGLEEVKRCEPVVAVEVGAV